MAASMRAIRAWPRAGRATRRATSRTWSRLAATLSGTENSSVRMFMRPSALRVARALWRLVSTRSGRRAMTSSAVSQVKGKVLATSEMVEPTGSRA